MCGIAGYISSNKISDITLQQTLSVMHQRGPDDKGTREFPFADSFLGLLHTRLRIIDLDKRSNQPFHYEKKWIVFNGEIYNYLELRQELIDAGIKLTTNSDTEVLIALIHHFGFEALDKCEGMWAFALFDEEKQELHLSRDRFGEKPLYIYNPLNNDFYFASEINAIQCLVESRLQVNYQQILRYLVNGYKSLYKNTETFFNGIKVLQPGTVLTINRSGVQDIWQYWIPSYDIDESITYNDALISVKDKLISAVDIRLRADVPLAFCMSGGVDSNALISIAKRVFDYDVHGFTIVNTDERYEEQDIIDQTKKELSVKHEEIRFEKTGFIENLQSLVTQRSAPVSTVSYYAHWLLIKSLSEKGYKISLSGTAADEIFSGYFDHHNAYLQVMHKFPEKFGIALNNWEKVVKPTVRNPFLRNPYLYINNPQQRNHIYLGADKFSSFLHKPWSEPFDEMFYHTDLMRNRMLNEIFHEATPVILHEDDSNAMYFSVENRSPFLDRRLFEYCNKVPTEHLIKDGKAKSLLRESMREIVPDCVLDNPRKVGLNAPIKDLLDVKNKNVVQELLKDSPVFDVVKKDAIQYLIDKPELPNSESKFLFNFLNTKLFLEAYA